MVGSLISGIRCYYMIQVLKHPTDQSRSNKKARYITTDPRRCIHVSRSSKCSSTLQVSPICVLTTKSIHWSHRLSTDPEERSFHHTEKCTTESRDSPSTLTVRRICDPDFIVSQCRRHKINSLIRCPVGSKFPSSFS